MQLKRLFKELLHQDYETDGLIMNTNARYSEQQIFKWKPLEKLSIDLYCYEIKRSSLSGGFALQNINKIPIVLFTHVNRYQFK